MLSTDNAPPDPSYYDYHSEDETTPPILSRVADGEAPESHSLRPEVPRIKRQRLFQDRAEDGRNNGSDGLSTLDVSPAAYRLLEPSWINAEPIDDFIRQIGDFIVSVAKGHSDIEVEAKLGILVDTNTSQRVRLPTLTEIILPPDYPNLRFESNMSLQQHAHYNKLLNERVQMTNARDYQFARLKFHHSKVVDSFYPGPQAQKIRVSRDAHSDAIQACVVKRRIADLNVYSPRFPVDWRVSVSTEEPAREPMTAASHVRRKDRMTYTHQKMQIDLTQVASLAAENNRAAAQPNPLSHELEVEFRDASELMQLAAIRGGPSREADLFDEYIRVFVNDIRILVRNAL